MFSQATRRTDNSHYMSQEHSWQFFRRFLYGGSVNLNLDRPTPVRLSNRVIAFNQSKRSEWFRRLLYFISLRLKGYSNCQSHFSEINAKFAVKNEHVTHFAQKCLETRENEQNVVLNESSEALGNRSEILRILVLAITTARDGTSGSHSV